MEKKIVNKDYIGVIRNVNGQVKFVKEDIPQKTVLMNELEEIWMNPNMTIFDLQSRMDREFEPSVRSDFYNYIFPYAYSTTYVDGVPYPKAPSVDEYKKDIEERREKFRRDNEGKLAKDKEDEYVEKSTAMYIKEKKQSFYDSCVRFCYAYSYSSLFRELRTDSDVKILTANRIGWDVMPYCITDDIKIRINTNFGYGGSSYFFLSLTYKGIDILPYSFFVTYYYANHRDIARYTRRYAAEYESWDYALKFVEDVANVADKGDGRFINTFVKDEIESMLVGLRKILNDPETYFNKNIANYNPENDSHYLSVLAMDKDKKEHYAAYPREMINVFQAEKISGALDFLDKISQTESIYSKAREAVDEIRMISRKFVPELERNMTRIASDVARLQRKEDKLSSQINSLELRIKPFKEKMKVLYEKKCSEAAEGEKLNEYMFIAEYSQAHPEYKNLVNEKFKATEEYRKITNERCQRQHFHDMLEQCREDIEKSEE